VKQNPKTQIPRSREFSKTKIQKVKTAAFDSVGDWMFEICLAFGDWNLEFREA
jgi:hypothetical protein